MASSSSSSPLDLTPFPRTILLILILLITGLSHAEEINSGADFREILGVEQEQQSQREFDYFLLSLLWPGTSCRNARQCCSSSPCCRGSKALTEFTIHGLWSNYNDGTWPSCCTGKKFDLTEISRLSIVLNKYWPTYNCSLMSNCYGGEGLFWEHEWEKHGTCSARVTGDEHSYFMKTLDLYFKYNVTEILRKAGYVASNCKKYPLQGIISAIQHAFHATPELVCSDDAVDELRLCFYKDFKPRDCGVLPSSKSGNITTQSTCPEYVSLPSYVYSNVASS